jgi:hypothetical protein
MYRGCLRRFECPSLASTSVRYMRSSLSYIMSWLRNVCHSCLPKGLWPSITHISLYRLSSIFHLLMGVTSWRLPFENNHGLYTRITLLSMYCTPFCHGSFVTSVDNDTALVVHTRIPPVLGILGRGVLVNRN